MGRHQYSKGRATTNTLNTSVSCLIVSETCGESLTDWLSCRGGWVWFETCILLSARYVWFMHLADSITDWLSAAFENISMFDNTFCFVFVLPWTAYLTLVLAPVSVWLNRLCDFHGPWCKKDLWPFWSNPCKIIQIKSNSSSLIHLKIKLQQYGIVHSCSVGTLIMFFYGWAWILDSPFNLTLSVSSQLSFYFGLKNSAHKVWWDDQCNILTITVIITKRPVETAEL